MHDIFANSHQVVPAGVDALAPAAVRLSDKKTRVLAADGGVVVIRDGRRGRAAAGRAYRDA